MTHSGVLVTIWSHIIWQSTKF